VDGGRRKLWPEVRFLTVEFCFFLFFARSAFALYFVLVHGRGASPLNDRSSRHAHDVLGDAVGLPLILVAGLIDGQLGLKHWRGARHHAQNSLISNRALQ
jgi:hypothetical protein